MKERRICEDCGKVCFSRREAGESLKWFRGHKVYKKKKDRPMSMYKCKYCGEYHLSHYKNLKRGRR